ncbi:MAG: NGG1p interacting factor 3 protein [Firmicutes bacterium]|nr:NGG1p interacting factor 3 protein [Bacillota bacterium]
MSVKCDRIIKAIEELAPINLAESWDNPGLMVGSASQDIEKVLVALDVTPEVANKAVEAGVDLIIAHHPLIFHAIKNIRTDSPLGKTLSVLIKHDIAVYAAHTNLDSAAGGVNDLLADKLGLSDCQPLEPSSAGKLLKLVVFVPESHSDKVRDAVTRAGAGHIGKYSHCTFSTGGIGTFLPLNGTNPFIGKIGQLEQAGEVRLETILPEKASAKVVTAMLEAHPYEEVAYDLYPLSQTIADIGMGRVGELAEPVSLLNFAQTVKGALGVDFLRVVGDQSKKIKTVAVCGGAGSSFINQALKLGADVLVTGDIKYDEGQQGRDLGIGLIDAGHFPTERLMVNAITTYLQQYAENNEWTLKVKADESDKDVFYIV